MTAQATYALAFGLLMTGAEAATALALSDCARTTHISHGGEDMHRDLGEGRVMWRNWWSQEGTATDYVIVDCDEGKALSFRTQEENMGDRPPFDRTNAALEIVETHESGARVFATLERMAADLERKVRDVNMTTLDAEPCACAALYAGLRGDKDKFVLGG